MMPPGPVHHDDDGGVVSSAATKAVVFATPTSSPKLSPTTTNLRRRGLRVPAVPLVTAAAAASGWAPPSAAKDRFGLLPPPAFMADFAAAAAWLTLVIPSPPESATPEDTDAETDVTGSSCPPSPCESPESSSSDSPSLASSPSASASRRGPAPPAAQPLVAAESTYFQPVRLGGGVPHAGRVLEFVVFVAVAGWAWSCAVDWLWLARSATTYSTFPDLAARAAGTVAAFVCLITFVAEWWRVNVLLGSLYFAQQHEHAAGDMRN